MPACRRRDIAYNSSPADTPFSVSKNVFYEEEGDFKVGAVLADNDTSLQVEAPHGKRSKIKAANVLSASSGGGLGSSWPRRTKLADDIDVDFLWQCCGAEEFAFDALAASTSAVRPRRSKPPALSLKLHGAPMYFYKKGRGRYKAAPRGGAQGRARARRAQAPAGGAAGALRRRSLTEGRLPARVRARCSTSCSTRRTTTRVEWKALEEAATLAEAHARAPDRALRRGCRHRTTTTSTASCSSIFRAARRFPPRGLPARADDLPLARGRARSASTTSPPPRSTTRSR